MKKPIILADLETNDNFLSLVDYARKERNNVENIKITNEVTKQLH